MKKVMLAIFMFVLVGTVYAFDRASFCDGYEDGYKEGYCDGKIACVKPITPICPVQNVGESTYRDGYNRGFKEGLRHSGGGI